MASKFRREATSARRADTRRRKTRKRLLIVCGGARTEKDYFEALRDAYRNLAVTIRVRTDTRSPLHVVETAVDLFASASDDFDECWAVFDVDSFDHGRGPHGSSNLARSIAVAQAKDVRLAISNPCFEYWLLLHFCDHEGHLPGYKSVRAQMKRHVPKYEKSGIRIADYADGVEDAVARARKRDQGQRPPGRNPNTAVWRVVDQMITGSS